MRVLRFWQGEYRELEWFGYRVIPKTIQSARLECPMENPPLGRHVELIA